jgi:hypothetical protein
MDVNTIVEIALERMLSELCLKYYLEPHPEVKIHIYENEIMPLYKKINKIG